MTAHEQHPPPQDTPPPPRNLRRIGVIAVLAAIAIAALGILQRRSHEAEVRQWTQEQAVPTVAVITPRTGASTQRLVLPGTVQAWFEAPIYARVNGYLKKWNFDYGAHVKKGDVLAEIETPDLDSQLGASEAKLNSARAVVRVREAEEQFAQSTYQRWRDSPKGVVSVQEQESKQADYNSAKARLSSANAEVAADQGEVDRLRTMANFKNITVPFDGVVTARETDVGALINAGSGTGGGSGPELFKVADIHMMRVYVQVPQQLSAGIKAGLTAELHLPQYPNKTFKGAVATTSSAINPNARTLLVELHADNPDGELQPGAYAQVDFELPSDPNIVRIPTSALVFREQGMEVAAIDANSTIELRPIKLGRNLGTEVEVVQGLKLSDRLVNSPPDSLATGDKVRVAGAPQESGAAEQQTREPGREENAAEAKPH
jgi:RND family efflux transporter MFP subunit